MTDTVGPQFGTLRVQRDGGCGWIVFNRPRVMNAFNRRQWTELNEALAHFEQDDETRCVVLRGSGGNFSSGYDLPAALDELEGAGAEGAREHIRPGNEACWRVWQYRKPTIAAVEGYCLGGAFELAMACDFVIAEEAAQLGEPEGRVAASPPFLITPWVMGLRHAKEVLLMGGLLSAAQAERMGLISSLCAQGGIEAAVAERVHQLAGFSPGVWYANKLAVNRSYEIMGLSTAIAMGEDAFVELALLPDSFKTELFERVKRDGFASAVKWAQGRHA
jgi:enoyl-CoA hydratase